MRHDDNPDSQERLLPFLLNPNCYPHRPRRVRLVQTHSSFVFIAPPFVYKVKKAVNFGFLDFSTLEKRRHFCEREVMLNRRLSPKTYLGVVPVARRNGGFSFDGPGPPVEYAVKMRKLSDRYFLDRLVARNDVTVKDLKRIAATLKSFYEAQHPTQEIEDWGRIDRLKISTDENFRQTEVFTGKTISRPAFDAIRSYTNRFYMRHKRLFVSRIRERRIRDCHGDLHLEHIHLTPRALRIYDCIEFNDRFRYVDVANDVAFLAMDLDYEGRPDLARKFVARMSACLGDPGMLRLIDFYKCYRAYVRGKVESLHSVAAAAPDEERQASAGRARRYFQLALQYAVAGSRPVVFVLMGRSASGKSTLAQALGAKLGWKVFSSDYLRKKMAGFPLYERSSAAARKRLYARAMTRQTYVRLLALAEAQIKTGHCVILDATFARRAHRNLLANRFGRRGIAWQFVEARATNPAVKRRLRARESRHEEVSDARLGDYEMLNRQYEPPVEVDSTRCLKVRTAGPLVRIVTGTLRSLIRRQMDSPCPTL